MKRYKIKNRIIASLLGLTLIGGDILPALAAVPGEEAVEEEESVSGGEAALNADKGYLERRNELVKGGEKLKPTSYSVQADKALYSDSAFPYSYDRESDIRNYFSTTFPAVRNNNPYGADWAHSAVSLAEFYLITHGFVQDPLNLDLSEMHLAYFTYTQGTVGAAPYTGDKVLCETESIEDKLDFGGHYIWAAQTLMRQRGLADEKTAPYPNSGTPTAPDASLEREDRYYLYNAYQISLQNTEQIKEAIIDNGSVGVSFCYNDYNYNADTNAYYCDDVTYSNHTVTLVGWDDAYPASNFKNAPPGNGAWLVRNSWNDGNFDLLSYRFYFWISYNDTSLSSTGWVYEAEPVYYDNHYYYDSQIHGDAYVKGSFDYCANVYTANGNERLSAVSLAVNQVDPKGTEYEIQIYKGVETGGDPTSGVLVSPATTSGVFYYDGYYTIDLQKPVDLKSGESFAIVVKRNDGNSVVIESNLTYAKFSATVGHDSGQSFFSSTGNSWSDLDFMSDSYGNFVITALTNNIEYVQADKPTASIPSGSILKPGQKIELTSATEGASIYYTVNGSVPTIDSSRYDPDKGIVLSKEFDGYTITIKAIAVADGYDISEVSEFTYVVEKEQEPEDYTLSVTQADGVYGTELAKPVYAKPDETGTESLSYSGVIAKDSAAYGPSAKAPALPGHYTVSVEYKTADKTYSGSAAFEIKKAEWDKKLSNVPGEAGKEGRFDLKKYIADGGVINADTITVVSGENQLNGTPLFDNTTLLCRIKDNVKTIKITLDIPVTGMDNYNDYSITVNIIGQGADVSDGKIKLNDEEVGSLTEAFSKMKDPYKDYTIDIGVDIMGEKNLTIPKTAKSVTIYGNGHTVEIMGTKLTSNVPLSIDNLKIKAFTKSRLAAKFTIMAKKDLDFGDGMIFETAATTVKCNGRLVLTGLLDAKTVKVKDMTLDSRAVLKADAGSNITIKGALKGYGGKIELGAGFSKPLKLNGTVEGNITITGKKQADGTQILKCSAKKIPAATLKKSFDLSDITDNAVDTYLYYFGAGNAVIFGESIGYNGNRYGVWKDAVAAMNTDLKAAKKSKQSISFVISLEGNVNMKGGFKLPSKGYESIAISGKDSTVTFTGDIKLSGNTSISGVKLNKTDKQGRKVAGKVIKGKYTYDGPEIF